MALRVRTFEHIHRLSIAEQTEEKRGVFVARVTADVDTLSAVHGVGRDRVDLRRASRSSASLALMLVYSWQLALAVVAAGRSAACWSCLAPGPVLGRLSTRARTRVGQMLSEVSESVMGAAVVRAYGLEDRRPAA